MHLMMLVALSWMFLVCESLPCSSPLSPENPGTGRGLELLRLQWVWNGVWWHLLKPGSTVSSSSLVALLTLDPSLAVALAPLLQSIHLPQGQRPSHPPSVSASHVNPRPDLSTMFGSGLLTCKNVSIAENMLCENCRDLTSKKSNHFLDWGPCKLRWQERCRKWSYLGLQREWTCSYWDIYPYRSLRMCLYFHR